MVSGTSFTLLPLQCIQEKTVDGTTRDRFQILERVGGGSFGVTHKVTLSLQKIFLTILVIWIFSKF